MKINLNKIVALIGCLIFISAVAAQNQLPKAEVRNVEDEYFGTKIIDPYRWMENDKSPEFVGFLKSQADYARTTLDKLPLRKEFQHFLF